MDTLQVMLLSMMIGVGASTGGGGTGVPAQTPPQQVVFEQISVAQALPTPQIIYVTPAPAPTQAGQRTLSLGSQGDDVREVQARLKALSYSVSVDGTFGTKTKNAVIAFQRNNGLKADGIVGSSTYKKLMSDSAKKAVVYTGPRTSLSYGMSGADVRDLQTKLTTLGYYADVISGNYLTKTRNAVQAFQLMNGLTVDGIAGPTTLARINNLAAVPVGNTPTGTLRSLSIGMSGEDVGQLQRRLAQLGYFSGQPTNYFGTETEAAVRLFQSTNGLLADGIAGVTTQNKLYGVSIATNLPSATAPTYSNSLVGTACPRCSTIISANDVTKHTTLGRCGQHFLCEGGDHITPISTGCGHYYCQIVPGGLEHRLYDNCNLHFMCHYNPVQHQSLHPFP